jgi:hypothetical protein
VEVALVLVLAGNVAEGVAVGDDFKPDEHAVAATMRVKTTTDRIPVIRREATDSVRRFPRQTRGSRPISEAVLEWRTWTCFVVSPLTAPWHPSTLEQPRRDSLPDLVPVRRDRSTDLARWCVDSKPGIGVGTQLFEEPSEADDGIVSVVRQSRILAAAGSWVTRRIRLGRIEVTRLSHLSSSRGLASYALARETEVPEAKRGVFY